MTRNLVLILGDQLSHHISSLQGFDPAQDIVVMAEVAEEAGYVGHHKKKIAFIFSAMRHFAEALKAKGYRVEYVRLDDADNSGSFAGELERAVAEHAPDAVIVTHPGEWRVKQALSDWGKQSGTAFEMRDDDRFVATIEEFNAWADGRKSLRMEYFYRDMRRKTRLLMTGDKPEGGRWNYDTENRKPAEGNMFMPSPKEFVPDDITQEVLTLVAREFPDHFGDLEPFWFAATSDQAEAALEHFVTTALADFGAYQDAMLVGERFLYHSVISLYINIGLLDPLHVCQRIEAEYHSGGIPLNSAEGFIRQIIGWREYVRGIYWREMPDYGKKNFFNAKRPLPDFYWTGDTDLLCLKEAITQTKEEAYAHHIQRLMVTGNFALLIGADPHAVHEWYLAVYADAFEWVEMPNTLGMSQFADGGLLGSKPYISGGNYINKMSNYCASCRYDVKQKPGPDACPFNSLYWHFLERHKDQIGNNGRLMNVYRTWGRMDDDKREDYLSSAEAFLEKLDQA